MGLIEQFGYEAVKGAAQNYRNSGDNVTVEKFEQAMLEYRRQHNIFEEGDYYVYLHDWDCDLDIVCKFNVSEWSDHLWNITNMIRHATIEEIKARRRL